MSPVPRKRNQLFDELVLLVAGTHRLAEVTVSRSDPCNRHRGLEGGGADRRRGGYALQLRRPLL
jgi:hypothetical protein